jgi:plasmid maintenance system antidote protein VapI
VKSAIENHFRTLHLGDAGQVMTLCIDGKDFARDFLLELFKHDCNRFKAVQTRIQSLTPSWPSNDRVMKIIYRKADPNDPLVKSFAEPFSLECEIEFCKLQAVEELLQFMKREGINRSELAERMRVLPSRITKMLDGSENLTIATLVRAGRAVGGELKIHFQPTKKASTAVAPDAQTQAPSRTGSPAGKKSKSSLVSRVLKTAKGKSGSSGSKSLNPDDFIHRVAEDPTPYRTKRKSK